MLTLWHTFRLLGISFFLVSSFCLVASTPSSCKKDLIKGYEENNAACSGSMIDDEFEVVSNFWSQFRTSDEMLSCLILLSVMLAIKRRL
jgi:hypothetical protein